MSPLAVLSLLAVLFISAHSAEDVASATVATDHQSTKIVSHVKKVIDIHDIKDVTDVPIEISTADPEGTVPTTVIDEATTTTKFQTYDDTPLGHNTTTKHVVRSSGMLLLSVSIGTVVLSML